MAVFDTISGVETDRVKTPIVVPFVIVLAFVVGAFLTIAYMFEERDRARDLAASVRAVELLFLREVEKDANIMSSAIDTLIRSEEVKAAFLGRDRWTLLALARPRFKNLRSDNDITHLSFIGVDRVNILRAHDLDRHGDVVERQSIMVAERTGLPVQGVELAKSGDVFLRVVIPWRSDGRLIGYVELAKEIHFVIEEIRQILGLDLAILIYKKYLERENWEAGPDRLGGWEREEWDRFGDTVIVSRTMEKVPAGLAEILASGQHSKVIPTQMKEDGKILNAAFLPLFDIVGDEIGDIIVVRDVTRVQFIFQDSIALIVSLCILAGGIAFSLFSVILRRVDLVFHRQQEVETKFSRLTTEHQRIVQTEKLSAMGMMIGEIAHQINNPLVGVVNLAQLAEREVDDPVRTRELLADIRKAGEHCRAFVQRMLEFTTISRSENKPTDIKQLIDETVSLFQQSVGRRMSVVTELAEGSLTLNVDPILIRHALFNLLTNAAQASGIGGTITVRLNRETGPDGATPGWNLSVIDRGSGLADDIIDNIFTPFFSTRHDGTGLGLPVVQHIAISHGGQITAENIAEGGARFAMWLPES